MDTPVAALLDGTLVDVNQPLIHVDDYGVLRGDGIFETTLAVDGRPRDLVEHLARLEVSAGMLDLTLPPLSDWHRGIDAVLVAWTGGAQMVLRLIATRGREGSGAPTCFVLGGPVGAGIARERADGIAVLLLDRGFAGEQVATLPWLLAGAKTLSYAMNMAARRWADRHGADDVVFVGTDGHVLEGPTATVVIARGRLLITPPVEGILAGVTVRRLFRAAEDAGWEAQTAPLTPDDLRTADGVWLVSGVRLLAPVVSIDGTPRARGAATGELAALLEMPGS
ncbi:aminodeoxychorismate lyase [Nakamurella deserti]|uniref:aminodeoxychorismate lyase n=1 Tax=Nakamurella deserti TaxID=2164074 RepID=UPI000DBE6F2F|nr:aminodeoxychorismate lyase [Nakamurella deserti]